MRLPLLFKNGFGHPPSHKQIAFIITPLIVALLIILKVFFMPGCAGFDENDEGTHTFVNLFVSRDILKAGEMPMMNMYNNFGTPLLGDTLTFPFGPQSLTYWILPDPYAMTVNRFILAFLTMFLLTFYFSRYVSLLTASVCALLVFCAPGHLWHFAHHHYQMTLLLFTAALLAQETFSKTGRAVHLFGFWGTMTLLFLSTNMNPILIVIPFLLGNQIFISKLRADRKFLFCLALIAAAALFYYPDLLTFFKMIGPSARVGQEYMSPIPATKVLLSVFRWTEDFQYQHLLLASYFSVPLLAMTGIGLYGLIRNRDTRPLALRTAVLGIAPVVFILLLLGCWRLWTAIPFLRNTDITRVWWFSNVFLMVGLGRGLDLMRTRGLDSWFAKIFGGGTAVLLVSLLIFLGWKRAWPDYTIPSFLFVVSVLLYAFIPEIPRINAFLAEEKRRTFYRQATALLFTLSILGAQSVAILKITGLQNWSACHSSHYFSDVGSAYFQPQNLLDAMEPYSRVACELLAVHGHDAKAVRRHVFGSNQRTVLPNKAFGDYLLKESLVEIDQEKPLSYHFKKPVKADIMSSLGIRYSIYLSHENLRAEYAPGEPFNMNRKPTAAYGELLLSANPVDTSVIYLMNGEQKTCLMTDRVTFKGNGMAVQLPPLDREQELVATFVAIPGWEALVDGEKRQIYYTENRLIRITVGPGDRQVVIRYAPFRWYHFLLGIFSSAGILLIVLWLGRRKKDFSHLCFN